MHARPFLLLPSLLFFLLAASAVAAEEPHYYWPVPAVPPAVIKADVAIYGGTPAGVAAAIEASRLGRKTILLSFNRHVGGLTSGGLTATDLGKPDSIGGLAREFYQRLGVTKNFRPSEAEALFVTLLHDAGVQVLFERRLESVQMQGTRITSARMENNETVAAAVFIDTSYEGDLLAAAGVSYRVGREPSATYGENLNGVQFFLNDTRNNFVVPLDPFRRPGDPSSGLLPEIATEAGHGNTGDGDARVQAYNFRMFLSDAPNRVPFPKPANYDPLKYGLLARYINADPNITWNYHYAATPMHDGPVQLRQGDSNNAGAFSTDYIGGSHLWPDGTYRAGSSASTPIPVRRGLTMPFRKLYELREKIFQAHVCYQQGLMFFLANDPSVPAAMRVKVNQFGLDPREFAATAFWPHQLYIREARRMVSDYVMTQHNCQSKTVAPDSIGLASYNLDSHNCQRTVLELNGRYIVRNEGNVGARCPHPYPVSYRAIVPPKAECTNLLVPVCLSCTHIAYGSIRMEPVFMILGQSAGAAASLAIERGVAVQDVAYPAIREQLRKDGQLLEYDIQDAGAPATSRVKAGTRKGSGK